MKITKRQLRRIIREEKQKLLEQWQHDPLAPMEKDVEDEVLSQAIAIFGDNVYIDERGGEIIVDVGDDTAVERFYGQWQAVWPDGIMEDDGLIYTGVRI